MSADSITAAYTRAVQLHRAGNLAEAEALYREILAVNPNHADATHLLGVAAHQRQSGAEAARLIQRAIDLQGDNAEYHNNLGEVWRAAERMDDALAAYRAAIAIDPKFAIAHNNLGVVLLDRGEVAAAEQAFRSALQLRPDYVAAAFNLGNALQRAGRLDEAVAIYRAITRHHPRFAPAHLNVGQILLLAGRLEPAAVAFEAALAADPTSGDACNNLGNVAKDQGNLDGALDWYRKALELSPDNHIAHSNLVYALLFHPAFDESAIQAEHERWRQRHAAAFEAQPVVHSNDRRPGRRLRIGYVSPFFTAHVVGWNLLPLLRHHDRSQFEIFCYSDALRPDEVTAEFRQRSSQWRESASWSMARLAHQIRADQVDVLVDLTLHMAQNRLLTFAQRPAPVQATFAGYPGTTGLRAIRHRLTDEFLDPIGRSGPYTEESLRLPSFWCFLPRGDEPDVGPLPAAATGRLTFGCLNNFCKVTAPTLQLWSQVLRAVPDSRLLLLAATGDHRTRTLALLARDGIHADRVEFVPRLGHREYMATYQRIDIALDTLPYQGHTTSCDALFMGVPVVTLIGQTVVGRAGLSQLSNLGLTDLITHSDAEFVAVATRLARDLTRLAELRATLRSRMQASPLMDAAGFTLSIENAFQSMWRTYCDARS
jgi:protein O-GlcNAc transferase